MPTSKKKKKLLAVAVPIVCVFTAFIIVLITIIIPQKKMNKAMSLLETGDYDSAYALLEEIKNHEAVASSKYERAVKLIDFGEYESAYMLLNGLSYKDSNRILESIIPQYQQILSEKANVGDTVYFGSCEQDNNTSNGKEGVEWVVLAKEDGKVLVISKYALECREYNSSFSDTTWEKCSLRTWMNETFLNDAFTTAEQEIIATANVSADENPKYGTDPGNATDDKVFLLSIKEVENYFVADESRICAPTAYAKSQGAYTTGRGKTASGEAGCCWWLRTPGSDRKETNYVNSFGNINYIGYSVSHLNYTVRPALWIDLAF